MLLNGRYSIEETLNKGSFGLVSLVTDTKTGERFAAKRVEFTDIEDESGRFEVKILQQLGSHPHIVQLIDYFEHDDSSTYLILEYCSNGDLYEAIKDCNPLASRRNVAKLMQDLISAVRHSHYKGVYHRDIKPENIMLDSRGNFKLADWGLSTTELNCDEFGVGSEQYMAPECFDSSSETYDAAKADIWMLGICMLNMLFGRNPFKRANQSDRLFTNFAANRETLFDIFPTLSSDAFKVLRHCLTIDPTHRSLDHMAEALAQVQTWTTDDEFEQLAAASPAQPSWLKQQRLEVPGDRPPFQVPSPVAISMTPLSVWDRRTHFTPPVSRMRYMRPMQRKLSHVAEVAYDDDDDDDDDWVLPMSVSKLGSQSGTLAQDKAVNVPVSESPSSAASSRGEPYSDSEESAMFPLDGMLSEPSSRQYSQRYEPVSA